MEKQKDSKAAPERPVPVVRAIVADAEGRILMLRRGRGIGVGQWCLPGGKIDYGQTVEEALRSELKEETALDCESFRFLFYEDNLPADWSPMHCLALFFECAVSGEIVLNAESSDHAWVAREELGRYTVAFDNDRALARYWDE